MERVPLFTPQQIHDIVALRDMVDMSISPHQVAVFDALKPYQDDPQKLFPPGISQEIVALLVITAAVMPSAWEEIAKQHDSIDVPQLMRERYLIGVAEEALQKKYEVSGPRISQISREALKTLRTFVPREAVQKFTLERVSMKRERGYKASSRSATRRWTTASRQEHLDVAVHTLKAGAIRHIWGKLDSSE